MLERSMGWRIWVTAGLLVAGIVVTRSISHGERIPVHRPLRELPLALGGWQGGDQPMEGRIVKAVGVDDYVSRVYLSGDGEPLGLYVGYYESQRTGDTIHSPKNCLPGAGWEPVRSRRLSIQAPGERPFVVNEYVVQKGLDRQLVIYWYQSRGRVVASEYWGKVWQVVDAIRLNRTDGALVRLSTPASDDEQKAQARILDFAQALYPQLTRFLPN